MPAATITPAVRDRVAAIVERELGIVLAAGRHDVLDRALAEGARHQGLTDPEQFARRIIDGPDTAGALRMIVPRLTINETHFFRNRPQFDALRDHILPGLLSQRGQQRRLRVWSAACSTGEEPYSVAMLLREILGARIAAWDITITATDLDEDALSRARQAVYGRFSFRETPHGLEDRHFEPVDERRVRVRGDVRDMVDFQALNLISGAWPDPARGTDDIDLLLCRNVLIYFQQDTIRRVVGRLHAALRPGGWLLVGHSEPSIDTFKAFRAHNFSGTVAYQRDRRNAGATRAALGARQPQRPPRPARPPVTASTPSTGRPNADTLIQQARAAADRGDWQACLDLSARAASAAPTLAAAHYLHGVALTAAGRAEEAVTHLRRACFLSPGQPLPSIALAQALQAAGHATRAARELDSLLRRIEGLDPAAAVTDGDGLTYGRLAELAAAQRATLTGSLTSAPRPPTGGK